MRNVVLFLGPMARFTEKIPAAELERPEGGSPRFFYFQYRPFLMRQEEVVGDSIHRAVSALKGRTVIVHSPADLARAIEAIERP